MTTADTSGHAEGPDYLRTATAKQNHELGDSPLVSVVMVVCDVERYLSEAIESILNQTFREFEFIILDFGSTDSSKSIASDYAARDSRVRLHDIPHCGLAEARNASCLLAKGRYIAIQDADDISLPDRLMREVEFMEEHPEVGLLGGTSEWVDAETKPLWIHQVPTEDSEIRIALLTCCPFIQTSVMIRGEAFSRVGGYRAPFAPSEDYDLWLRISEHFQCANLKQVVVKYRIHPYQLSLLKRRQQTLATLGAQASASSRRAGNPDPFTVAKEITPDLLTGLGVSEASQQIYLFHENRNWIRNMFIAGQYPVALNAAIEVLKIDWKYVGHRQIADLYLATAQLHWRQKQFFRSFLAVGRAILIRPAVIGSVTGSLFRRVGLAGRERHLGRTA
jgi:glycosyltransferase involved in cell wall biosynthesis